VTGEDRIELDALKSDFGHAKEEKEIDASHSI